MEVLWYHSQAIYEGTKAYRKENGKVLLFRPDHNAIRMQLGAERMLMPSPSVDQFVDAVKQTAFANKRWVLKPLSCNNYCLLKRFLWGFEWCVLVRFLLQAKGLCTLGLCWWELVQFLVWDQLLNIHLLSMHLQLVTTSRYICISSLSLTVWLSLSDNGTRPRWFGLFGCRLGSI